MDTLRNTWVEVNLNNIVNNIREVRNNLKGNAKIGAVLKANAYGHGAIEVAKVMIEENVDYLCVASLNEALEIRKIYKDIPILVMGYISNEHIHIAIKNNITMTIFNIEQAINVSNMSTELSKVGKIHIKVDTGFNRLGFKAGEELINIIKQIHDLKNINIEGLFSHLALKDLDSDYKQFNLFTNTIEQIEKEGINIPIKHICDSIGAALYPNYHMDMVRIGASLYGYNGRKSSMNLKPALIFKSKISLIKEIEKGEGVSYDYTFVANHKMKIATIPCGYGDGIPRILSNKGYVTINNERAKIIGTICMDQCMVDITHIKDVNEDDEVIFYGENGIKLAQVANWANTNRNEILSLVSRRVPRVYYKDNKIVKILDYLSL
jgi:alanine racemase